MKTRSRELELIDVEVPTGRERRRMWGYLAFVNRWLGGTAAVAHHLRRWTGARTLLDVGAGSADVAASLARRFPGLRPFALDSATSLLAAGRGVPRVVGDARRLPFRSGSVDVVIASHLFHHLGEDDAVRALGEFARVAAKGVVVNDLLRRRRALLWIRLLTLFANRFSRSDGPLSVRRGFTLPEAADLARRAGLPWLRAREHFGHRFTLAGVVPG